MNFSYRQIIVNWNTRFPKDRRYRKKYSIAFGSPQHLSVNQIDVFLDTMEDELFEKYINTYKEKEATREIYRETGAFMKETVLSDKEHDDLFDKIDVSQFNSE